MFVAQNEKGELVELWRLTQFEVKLLKERSFFCPVCHRSVILRQGKRTRAHFAHYYDRDCQSNKQAESLEHMTGKLLLAEWLSRNSLFTVEVERYFSCIQRQADIIVNHQLVVEYQCSPIPIEQLIKRTHDYQKIGLQVVWILGSPLFLNKQLKSFHVLVSHLSKTYHRHFYQLDVKRKELIINHHLSGISDSAYPQVDQKIVTARGPRLFEMLKESASSYSQFQLESVPIKKSTFIRDVKQERQQLQRSIGYQQPAIMRLQKQLYGQKNHLMGLPPAFFWMRHNWLDNRMSKLALLIDLKTLFFERTFIYQKEFINQLDSMFQKYALDNEAYSAKIAFHLYVQAILKMWEKTGYICALPEGYRIASKLHHPISEESFNEQLQQEINNLSYYLMFPKH